MKFKTYNAVVFIRKDDSCSLTLLNCFTIFKLTGFVADIALLDEQRLKGNIFKKEKEKNPQRVGKYFPEFLFDSLERLFLIGIVGVS